MKRYIRLIVSLLLIIVIFTTGCQQIETENEQQESFPTPQIDLSPQQYICYRTASAIVVDGLIDRGAASLGCHRRHPVPRPDAADGQAQALRGAIKDDRALPGAFAPSFRHG